MAKSGYVNGSDLLLIVDGKALGHCTTHTTTFNSETKNRAVKPVASAGMSAGLWKNKGVTGLSITISGEGLAFYGDTESGYKALVALWKAGESVTVKCLERAETAGEDLPAAYLEGKFVITSLEETAPAQDDVTYSINLEIDGEPTTFDASKLSA